ncbi:MAG: hypothetical protein IJW13_06610, partial [Clostridia bacterium]|nr:hypothetical protein [Clostridia bacterium]
PFATPLAKPHQITSPRTQKPAKTSIDLTASKNVAKEQKNKSTGDMIDLINRHNRFSREIQNKNKP